MIHAGAHVRITEGPDSGVRAVIWSPAPSPGTYWAHIGGQRLVLLKIRDRNGQQHVSVEEDR